MSDKPYLVKLVRDKVGDFLADSTIEYRPIDDRDEAVKMLRGKLIEEAVEYVLKPSAHELADVQEVVDALSKLDPAIGVDGGARGKLAVKRAQKRKREERAGFDRLTGMYAQTTAGKWGDS